MRLDFDTKAGALSFEVSNEPVARTVSLDHGTLIDLDAAGNVVALEVLNPERPWPADQILGFDDPTGLIRLFVGLYPQTLGGIGIHALGGEFGFTIYPSGGWSFTSAAYTGGFSTSSTVRSGGTNSRALQLAS